MYGLSSSPDQQLHHRLASGGPELLFDDDVVPVDLIQNRRPFRCAYTGCGKTFKNPQTMKMHRKTHCSAGCHLGVTKPPGKGRHNKKTPSKCPLCFRGFVGLYELRRHFGRKHTKGEKKFGCTKCDKKFFIEVDLRDHDKLCGAEVGCICGLKFAFKCNLVAHKKAHLECQDAAYEADQLRKKLKRAPRSGKAFAPAARAAAKERRKSLLSECIRDSSSLPPLSSDADLIEFDEDAPRRITNEWTGAGRVEITELDMKLTPFNYNLWEEHQ